MKEITINSRHPLKQYFYLQLSGNINWLLPPFTCQVLPDRLTGTLLSCGTQRLACP